MDYPRKGEKLTRAGSPRGGRRRHEQPLTPADALDMLASAINYCLQAGLVVKAVNASNGKLLVLSVSGAQVTAEEQPRFVPVVVPSADAPAGRLYEEVSE